MTNAEWARAIWPVLVELAEKGNVTTYTEIAEAVGFGSSRLSRQLEPIYRYCMAKGLPPLTILVVEKRTRKPSPGAFEEFSDAQAKRELQKVYRKNWAAVRLPTVEELQAMMTPR